ncbi:DUF1857-domain-containing protein [Aaosphaeria arxii CBS 175.79]|uniref:DUF1857-domain-containing protein n=1 Tax=Aaosphaeria arxii CBS 175.79 TaxID=1450172 RepID=A0A6A5XKH1_9PLEO|nr:DUF1857-domain-containing protein [Aaosphaeria arxii CBS 175.79]KAF2013778.1 DUF1857-domain-containing protein [Aaosphaeria arxii CBS 175.79]
MVNINLAYTARINPEGATPVLTYPQIWAGLQRKIRFAQEFVPVIKGCEVLSDQDGIVKRKVQFQLGGPSPGGEFIETVTSYEPSWVCFEQQDGTQIRNIVSDGPSGEPDDLHMTYVFEYRLPNVEAGEAEAKERKRLLALAKTAVESSIKTIREMVQDGRIKE